MPTKQFYRFITAFAPDILVYCDVSLETAIKALLIAARLDSLKKSNPSVGFEDNGAFVRFYKEYSDGTRRSLGTIEISSPSRYAASEGSFEIIENLSDFVEIIYLPYLKKGWL